MTLELRFGQSVNASFAAILILSELTPKNGVLRDNERNRAHFCGLRPLKPLRWFSLGRLRQAVYALWVSLDCHRLDLAHQAAQAWSVHRFASVCLRSLPPLVGHETLNNFSLLLAGLRDQVLLWLLCFEHLECQLVFASHCECHFLSDFWLLSVSKWGWLVVRALHWWVVFWLF